MKAPNFDYARPKSLQEVFRLLREYGEEARILAGGQTLLATLNMRLSEPAMLIDINHLDALKRIEMIGDRLRIGALVRHCEIETSPLIAAHLPLLYKAAPHVAHAAIRNRGTFGGSIAVADPAAEWPACAVAMDAQVVLTDGSRERKISASDFFIDLYQTDLRPGEIIVACEFPLASPPRRTAFVELTRRHGDYAIVGVAASGERHDGVLDDLRIVFFGVGNTPVRALGAEAILNGRRPQAEDLRRARESLAEDVSPSGDLYSSAQTKQHLAGVLMQRAVSELSGE